jgi:hypothetical protein
MSLRQPEACSDPLLASLVAAFPAEADVPFLDPRVRRAIHRAHLGRDFYTQAPLPIEDMTLDHVIPLSKGGRDNLFNLVPTSGSLNMLKGDKVDAVALVSMLAIIRLYFGPRALALLAAPEEAAAGEQAANGDRIHGTPDSAAWFRAQLEALGMTQSGFAKWMKKRGDDRMPATILRHIQRMAAGEARVSGEMRVILSLMRDGQRKAMARQAAKNAAQALPQA